MPTLIDVLPDNDNNEDDRINDSIMSTFSENDDNDENNNNDTAGTSGILWWNEHFPSNNHSQQHHPSRNSSRSTSHRRTTTNTTTTRIDRNMNDTQQQQQQQQPCDDDKEEDITLSESYFASSSSSSNILPMMIHRRSHTTREMNWNDNCHENSNNKYIGIETQQLLRSETHHHPEGAPKQKDHPENNNHNSINTNENDCTYDENDPAHLLYTSALPHVPIDHPDDKERTLLNASTTSSSSSSLLNHSGKTAFETSIRILDAMVSHPCREIPSKEKQLRKMGVNEIYYRNHHQDIVLQAISKNTNNSKEYSTLSREEKIIEQQFVTQLLQRLGIYTNSSMNEVIATNKENEFLLHSQPSISNDQWKPVVWNDDIMSPIQIAATTGDSTNATTMQPSQKELFTPIPPTTEHEMETSLDLFASPNPVHTKKKNDPLVVVSSNDNQTKTSSVEQTRTARYSDNYDSPNTNHLRYMHNHDHDDINNDPMYQDRMKKRYASTSGKRGTDTSRLRRDPNDDNDIDDDIMIPSPSKFLIQAIDRMSMIDQDDDDDDPYNYNNNNDLDIFSSSQSPIVAAAAASTTTPNVEFDVSPTSIDKKEGHRRTTSMESIEADDDISFNDKHSYDSSGNRSNLDTPQRPNHPRRGNDYDSLVETTMLLDNKHIHWDYDHTLVKDAPTDVRLRQGETMRYPKLTTHRSRPMIGGGNVVAPVLTQSYPDPFCWYDEKVQRQLNRLLYTKMMHRDPQTIRRCGAVLSMTEQQITNIVLKLHLDHPVLDDNVEGNNDKGVPHRGKTLIVTRTKEELDMWRRAFREGSGLSIINHAAMTMAQRKHPTCPAKLVHYDIVLSTYDAIKSADIAMKMDTTTALAITNTNFTGTDGWYTTNSTQPMHRGGSGDGEGLDSNTYCSKALSAVHKLHWSRILLMDVLGRKGYLIKPDTTARVQAVRALNANVRWAFFVDMIASKEENVDNTQALCDRNTLLSLASTLRHPMSSDDNVDIAKLRQAIVFDFQP